MLDALPIPDPSDAPLAWGVVLIACVIGCVTDLRARRLPNILTLPLWLAGLVFATATGGVSGLGGAFTASVLLAIPYVILFVCAGGGAGDAKMMAALGAWLGLMPGLYTLVVIAFVGGAVGLAYGRLTPGECLAFMPPPGGSTRIPYGLAICLGTLVAFGGGLQWHV